MTAQTALMVRERSLCNGIHPVLAPVAMVLTQDVALRGFFRRVTVEGQEHLPREGAVLLAPTHRARWDALLLPHAAGRRITGRDCRFMVSSDEMSGLQGWFLHRLGCFPVNPRKPGTASLRYAIDLLEWGEQLVVFPEGQIRQEEVTPMRLRPGLARLALLARSQGVPVTVLPVGIAYGHARPQPGDAASICIAPPLSLAGGPDGTSVAGLNGRLSEAMQAAEARARALVGRPLTSA